MVRATGLATVTLGGGGAALVDCGLSPQLASSEASNDTAASRASVTDMRTPSPLRSAAYRRFRQNFAARSRQRDPSAGPPVRSFPARNGSPYEETGLKSIVSVHPIRPATRQPCCNTSHLSRSTTSPAPSLTRTRKNRL